MKLHASVAALMAAAGAFSYGSQSRAQNVPEPRLTIDSDADTGVVAGAGVNLLVQGAATLSNEAAAAGTDAAGLAGAGLYGERFVGVYGSVRNALGGEAAAIGRADDDDNRDRTTIIIGAEGRVTAADGVAVALDDRLAIQNSGDIDAGGDAVRAGDSLTVFNAASGTIRSTGAGRALSVAGAGAYLNLTNRGAIVAAGEDGGAAVAVRGDASGLVAIDNAAAARIEAAGDAAVAIDVSGRVAESGPATAPYADSIILRNDGLIASRAASDDIAAVTIDANGGGAFIYNGSRADGYITPSALIDAGSSNAILLSGSARGGGYGHYIRNEATIQAQADGRGGADFDARAVDIRLGAGDGDVFDLNVTNGADGAIQSRGDVFRAIDSKAYLAYGANISVTNAGAIRSDRATVISNGGNDAAQYANIAIDNAAGGSIYGQDHLVESRVSKNGGVVRLNIDNDGEIVSKDFEAAFNLRGGAIELQLDNGADGAITGAGDLFSFDAPGDFSYASAYIGGLSAEGPAGAAPVGVRNRGRLAAYGGSVFDAREQTGDHLANTVGVNVVNEAGGAIYGSVSVFNLRARSLNGAIVNDGEMRAGGTVVDVYAARSDEITVETGATGVIAGADGIYLDIAAAGRIVIANAGEIEASDGDAVDVAALQAREIRVTNTGALAATSEAVTVSAASADLIAIDNRGALAALGAAATAGDVEGIEIDADTVTEAAIRNAGVVDVSGDGIDVDIAAIALLSIENAGTIRAGLDVADAKGVSDGVFARVGDAIDVTVENSGGGAIEATGDGVEIDGRSAYNVRVANRGASSIASAGREGVNVDFYGDVDRIEVVNEAAATIASRQNGVDVYAGRAGEIIVDNRGAVRVQSEGRYGAEYTGVLIETAGGAGHVALSNAGTILSTGGDGVAVETGGARRAKLANALGLEAGDAGMDAGRAAIDLRNDGAIEGALDGVAVYGGYADDIAVTNAGSVAGRDGNGVAVSNAGGFRRKGDIDRGAAPRTVTVDNQGAIDAGAVGVVAYGGYGRRVAGPGPEGAIGAGYATDVTVRNGAGATITGATGVLAGGYLVRDVAVVNGGTVTGGGEAGRGYYGGFGVVAGGYGVSGSVRVENSGAIRAENGVGAAVFAGSGAPEARALETGAQTLSIVNSGDVIGAKAGVAAYATPSGYGAGPNAAPPVSNFAINIVNSGSISARAAEGAGVSMSFGAVENTGSIVGGAYGVLATGGYDDVLLNDGGRIEGGMAVSLGAGDDAVIARGAAVFVGPVDGGADRDSLSLDGFTGPAFTPLNFETVEMRAGSTLTLNAETSFGGGALFIDETSSIAAFGANNGLGFASVENRGRLNLQNGEAGDTLLVAGTLASTGALAVDVDPEAGASDRLVVEGGAAEIAGDVEVALLSTPVGQSEHVIATADGGLDATGAALNLQDSTVSTFALRNDANDLVLVIDADFAPEGLAPENLTFGAYLNANAGDPALQDVFALAQGAGSVDELQALYTSLKGVDFGQAMNSGLRGGMDFGASLFSCAVGEGRFAAIDEGQCGWTRIGGSYFDRDASGANPGVREDVFSVSAGGQFAVNENIRLGAGFGIDVIDSNGGGGLSNDATRFHFGASAKYVDGPMMVGVSASGGITDNNTERGTALGVADGDYKTFDFSAIARAAYLVEIGEGAYLKPQLQAGVTHVDRESFTETGAGAANLQVMSGSDTYFSFSPSVEIGAEFEADEVKIRPYLRVGATFLSEDDVRTTARLAGAGSAGTFVTTTEIGDVFGEVAVGATIFADEDVAVRAEYTGRFSDDAEEHGGFVKVQVNF